MGLLGDIAGFAIGGPIGVGAVEAMGGGGGLGGVGSAMGDMVTGGAISNAKAVSDTNSMQMQLANQQMAFQEKMSSTAYQRAMNDMKTAGLNPMLAFQQGGASTPSGAMANLTAPRPGDVGAGLMNTAKSIATQVPEIQNTMSQTKLNQANAQVADVSAAKLTANAQESKQNAELLAQRLETEKANTKSANVTAAAKQAALPAMKTSSEIDAKTAKWDTWIRKAKEALGTASSAKSLFLGGP